MSNETGLKKNKQKNSEKMTRMLVTPVEEASDDNGANHSG